MRKIALQDNWPCSWKTSHHYDLLEIYGAADIDRGYVYAYNDRLKNTLELIQKVAQPNDKILDLAAAQGNFSLRLAEMGYEVTWNDLRAELIDYVKLKQEKGTIHYVAEDVFKLNFDSSFNIVLITEIIEHVAHPDLFLKKVAEFVKPAGYVIMSTPNGEYILNRLQKFSKCADPSQFEKCQFKPDADGHIFALSLNEIREISQKAGLTILDYRYFINPLTNGHIKLRILLKYIPYSYVKSFENITNRLPMFLRRRLHNTIGVLFQRLI